MSVSKAIVSSALTLDNYDDWIVWMKNYLVGQGLWDIVDGRESEPPVEDPAHVAWRETNGRALHAIQISCGSRMFSSIKDLSSAKDAWRRLAVENTSSWGRKRLIMHEQLIRWRRMERGRSISDYMSVVILPLPGEEWYEDFSKYRILYNAAFSGDWETAKSFMDRNPDGKTARIDKWSHTALHIAAYVVNGKFVEQMVNVMPENSLANQNLVGFTALHIVTEGGTRRMAQLMLTKNRELLNIRDNNGLTPLMSAALYDNEDVFLYLYSETTVEDLNTNPSDSALILRRLINNDKYGLALDILRCCPEVATTIAREELPLQILARRPWAFKSGVRLGFWKRQIYSWVHVEQFEAVLHTDKQKKDHVISIDQAGMPDIVEQVDAVSYTNGRTEEHCLISADQAKMGICFLQGANIHEVLEHMNRLLWDVLQKLVPGIKQIRKKKLMHIQACELVKRLFDQVLSLKNDFKVEDILGPPLLVATKSGIIEFLIVALQCYPRLIEYTDKNLRSVLQIAVINRCEKIFNFLTKRSQRTKVRIYDEDIFSNNILHLAGKIAPSHRLKSVTGAALQMQRELQWFKEVEKMSPPVYKRWKNTQGMTPDELFIEEHQDLLAKGEKWMKDAAASCLVAGALIITIMFAAAFTVPGGFQSDTGTPVFLNTAPFKVFVISDAVALFSASTSLLMFLSILTSRYTENDFLLSLPKKVLIGLSMLYISVAAMMAAFSATIFVILSHHLMVVSILLTLLAAIPVTLFVFVHFPLFIDVLRSTCGSGIFN